MSKIILMARRSRSRDAVNEEGGQIMRDFRNILFVSHGFSDDAAALKDAAALARDNDAALCALAVCPELAGAPQDAEDSYRKLIAERLTQAVDAARGALEIDPATLPVAVAAEIGAAPAQRVIRHVLREGRDLVVKAAEPKEDGRGFKAMDMELLRKCPSPVWLARSAARPWGSMRVAVAVDPESEAPEGRDLALRLLELGRALADLQGGGLDVISCWDCPYEGYLRRSIWLDMSEAELSKAASNMQTRHRAALDALLAAAGETGRARVQHLRGRPEDAIPRFAAAENVDVLVMGTVARTGIPGFIIGNTAENVMQKLECSLLALKPLGFVSPVTAY